MTNTREEAALLEAFNAWIDRQDTSTPSYIDSFDGGYKAGSKYLPQLVAALNRIRLTGFKSTVDMSPHHIAVEALNNLPEELKQ